MVFDIIAINNIHFQGSMSYNLNRDLLQTIMQIIAVKFHQNHLLYCSLSGEVFDAGG